MIDLTGISDPFLLTTHRNNAKAFIERFLLYPDLWESTENSVAFAWSRVKFSEDQINRIPEQKGLYAFVIHPSPRSFGEVGYLMYIGEAGCRSNHNLKMRFKDYLSERYRIKNRPKINDLVLKWPKHLFFYYSIFSPAFGFKLKDLESDVLGYYVPPLNRNDFPAKVKALVRDLL